MSFSVIIPSRNSANLAACVSSICEQKETCRIIIVDDGLDNCPIGDAIRHIDGVKPFIFARNINLGIAAAETDDVIILNDDTRLLTDFGFSLLADVARTNPQYGIISAGMTGAVGNTEQIAEPGTRLRETSHHTLVFVCVYIRRVVLNLLRDERTEPRQWLDERYLDYGFDDDDCCEEVRAHLGLKLGVYDGCVVEHGVQPSSYRDGHNLGDSFGLAPNRQRFLNKWGFMPGQRPKPNTLPEPPAQKPKW